MTRYSIFWTGCFSVVLYGAPAVAGGKSGTEDMFSMADKNGDSKISRQEHADSSRKMFKTMDIDGNGTVTAAAMEAATEKAGRKPAPREMSAREKIKVVDKDGDGSLSAEKHEAGSRKMFNKMETNRDGCLSRVEMLSGHAKLMHSHQK